MKICVFTTSFLPKIGGAELVVHNLCTHFSSFGHSVVALVPPDRSRNIKFSYRVVDFWRGIFRIGEISPLLMEHLLTLNLLQILRRGEFDVVNAHMAYPAGYVAALARKRTDIPLVITSHGADVQKLPSIGYGFRLSAATEAKVSYALTNSDALTAISPSIKVELLNLGAEKAVIHNIENGVDVNRFKQRVKSRQEVFSKLRLPCNSRVILAVGRNHPVKGYRYLIEAMPQVLQEIPEAVCVILGRNTQRLVPLIEKLNLQKKVVLLGEIPAGVVTNGGGLKAPSDEVISIYKSSDIFVSSSLMESFSLVVLEAMAAGLPVVATNVRGIRDLVNHGNNGWLVEPRNPSEIAKAICAVLGDEKLRSDLVSAAIGYVEAYDWSRIARKYLSVFYSLINCEV